MNLSYYRLCTGMVFIVKCVTITLFFITYAALWWKSPWFLLFCHPLKLYMILYSTGTVFFHCSSLEDYVKFESFTFTVTRERQYTVHQQKYYEFSPASQSLLKSDNWVELKGSKVCWKSSKSEEKRSLVKWKVKSEVKSYLMWSAVKWNKVKRSEQSKVKWNEVKWSAVYRGKESLWKRFIGVVTDEKWRTGVKAWVN